MKSFPFNHYELAFENWLKDNRIQYIAVDEHKRAVFGRSKVKSFDFLLYPRNQRSGLQIIVAEVKGRKFKGTSFAKLTGFECWVTADDIAGLTQWQQVLGSGHTAAFIFAYRIENIDVDFDGRDVYDFNESKYIFFRIDLSSYCGLMKVRSPKWQTVTLPADDFRSCAVQADDLLL